MPNAKPNSKPQVQEPDFITREDAARLLSVSIQLIDKKIRDGSLTAFKWGGSRCVRIRRGDVLALLEAVQPWR